jgi:4-hydroxybenzoate polyprenyltransferase
MQKITQLAYNWLNGTKDYILLLRIDHWFKNIFMIAGIIAAFIVSEDARTWSVLPGLLIGLFATCLIASANYVLNEIIDGPLDRNHPKKQFRPIPSGRVIVKYAYIEYVIVSICGLFFSLQLGKYFFWTALLFLIMGMVYNIPPARTKELPYIDVLSESINNPIRLLLGWYAMGLTSWPPTSLVISYWMIGAFFMAAKRLAEYREIGKTTAERYRKSFRYYNEERLTASLVAYAAGFMFFFSVVIIKYHAELILAAPVLMYYIAFYILLTFDKNSIVQTPELLLKKPRFVMLNVLLVIYLTLLANISLPFVRSMLGVE